MRFSQVAFLSAALSLSAVGARAQDVVTTFNYLNAVNGPFTYGTVTLASFTSGIPYTLTQYDTADPSPAGTGVGGRDDSAIPGGLPFVERNTSGSTEQSGTVTLPTDVLNMHPGQAGNYSIVRFTAATTGIYTIVGRFQGDDNAGTTSDAHIRENASTDLFSAAVTGYFPDAATEPQAVDPFSITTMLTAGSTIDFAVGYGSNGNYFSDSTGLAATITETAVAPEPSALVLIALGGLPLLGVVTRRRKAGDRSELI